MGCEQSHVIEKKKINKNQENEILSPPISLQNSPKKYQISAKNKKFSNSEYEKNDENFEYNIKTFQILDKISDNLTYKKFKVLNTRTGQTQIMIVISSQYHLNILKIEFMSRIIHKSLVNIRHFFQDDYFYYIITDFINYNLYDAIFNFPSFSNEKLKKVIKTLLTTLKYLYEQKIPFSYFDFSKIYVLNEFADMKLEYYDIDELIDANTHHSENKIEESKESNTIDNDPHIITIEDIFYQLAKILITIFNTDTEKEIPYQIYDDDTQLDIDEIYQQIKNKLSYSEKEIIEKLLHYSPDTTFDTILSLSFFESYKNINYNKDQNLIKVNQALNSFYAKYNLRKSGLNFLHIGLYYKQNKEYFEELFNSFDGMGGEEIKIVQLATNIRNKMKNRFIPFEMMEIISFFSNMKITYFHIDSFIKILINYESQVSKNHLKKAFDFLDMKKTGKIKISLLKEIFNISFHVIKDSFEKEISEILEEVDKSEDHSITFNEFLYVLIKINNN